MTRVVFIGGGRITSALLAGLTKANAHYNFVVHDRHGRKMRQLEQLFHAQGEKDLHQAVEQADLLIIAVRPDGIKLLLREIGKVHRPTLAVSLAAGIPLRQLMSELGSAVRWARAMPSPTCRSGRGLTGVTFPRTLSRSDRDRVCEFFATIGQVIEIAEKKFDAFTVCYSASHGYHALHTLAHAGQRAGLDRRTALLAAAHALSESIASWRGGGHSLEALLQEAATPGGIAATTMGAMDAAGYGRTVERGVLAGLRRAQANAKNSSPRGNR